MKNILKFKKRILFVGDSLNTTSGLAYAIASIIKKFYQSKKYEIGFVTVSGADTTQDGMLVQGKEFIEISKNIKIYNTQILDNHKAVLFDSAIQDFKPDIVFSVLDPWVLDQISLSRYRRTFFWACYLTIETPRYPEYVIFPTHIDNSIRKSIKKLIGSSDLIIPCTKMAEKNLKKMGLKPSKQIYLGIDIDKKIKKEISKKEAFGKFVDENNFIFMTVGVNSDRKKIAKVIEAFYKFKQKVKDSGNKYRLYIHSDLDRRAGGTDLRTMVNELKINESILIPSQYQKNIGIDKTSLYRKYSACDCYIGLAGGEGFGYGFIEAMLHKKPIIYIDYGGHVEFCKNVGLSVKISDYDYIMNAHIEFALADTNNASNQMMKIAKNKNVKEINVEKGYEFVQSIDWEIQSKEIMNRIEENFVEKQEDPYVNLPLKRII